MSTTTTYHLGRGATLTGTPLGGAAVVIKQLKTISFSGNDATYEDISNMDSPSSVDGGPISPEFAPVTLPEGTVAIAGVFSDGDAGQLAMAAARRSQVPVAFVLQFKPRTGQTTGFKKEFTGFVQNWNGPADAQYDKAVSLSGTIKITGSVKDTPGTTASGNTGS